MATPGGGSTNPPPAGPSSKGSSGGGGGGGAGGSGGEEVRLSIQEMGMVKHSSARSFMSDGSRQSIDSSGAGDAAAAAGGGGKDGTGAAGASSGHGASTPTGGVMSQLAYNHSREARRLLKKEAQQRSVRGSGGSIDRGGTGGGGFVSPTPSEGAGGGLMAGADAGGGGEGGGDQREQFGSSRSSSISHAAALQEKAGSGSSSAAAAVSAMAPMEIGTSGNGSGRSAGRANGGSGGGGGGCRPRIPKPTWADTWRSLKVFGRMLVSKHLNILLLFAPFGILARVLEWGPGPVFFLNFVTLIPLASMLGDLTEEVADHMGDTVGGLLNASFGNAVEMVIGVQALVHNEVRVVQSSLLGSVLSNLLLVMGCCFLFGGIKHPEQHFSSTAAVANLSLLFLASIALVVPTPIGSSYALTLKEELLISRAAALFLLAMYIQLLFFQMVTHKHLFTDVDREGSVHSGVLGGMEDEAAAAEGDGEEEDEAEGEELGLWASITGLIVITGVVAVFSEFLVSSIDDVCREYKISKVFVGVILIPIVGNATEHMTAVTVAYKNRMELAMGIAVGSATQISVFVIPFLVIAGWILDRPMTLNFSPVELVLYIMSVIITIPVLTAGNSNWIHGSLLITCYLFISFAVWHENEGTPPAGASRRLAGAAGAWDGL